MAVVAAGAGPVAQLNTTRLPVPPTARGPADRDSRARLSSPDRPLVRRRRGRGRRRLRVDHGRFLTGGERHRGRNPTKALVAGEVQASRFPVRRRRCRPILDWRTEVGGLHELLPDPRRERAALHLGDPGRTELGHDGRGHRGVPLRIADPDGSGDLGGETDEPGVGVVVLRARFTRRRPVAALQRTDPARRYLG